MRGVLVAVLTVIVLGVGAGTASAGSECGDCTATYSGTWTVTTPKGVHVTLSFDESLQSGNWSLISAGGSYSEPANPENGDLGCTATLTRNAAASVVLGSFGPNVVIRKTGYWTVELFPPTYWGLPGDPIDSSVSIGDCGTSARVDYAGLSQGLVGSSCHFDPSAGNTEAIDFPVNTTQTANDSCSGSVISNTVEYDIVLASSVTFSSGLGGSGSPTGTTRPIVGPPLPAGPNFNKSKIDARDDLEQHAIPNATQYCLPFLTAAGLTGVGILGSLLPGGAGLTVAIAGAVTASATAPFCAATIKRLQQDYKGAHDPPREDFSVIARPAPVHAPKLASCARYAGSAAQLCATLRTAENRWVTTAEGSASVATAIEETISREHAALTAGNVSARNAQDAALKPLLADRRRATAAEAAAGKALARVLRGAHIRFAITKTQSAKVIARVKKQIAAAGVTAVDVIGLDEAGFKPRSQDLLAGLSSL